MTELTDTAGGYCRKIPLKRIVDTDIRVLFENTAFRVSEIVREAYQLIKLFALKQLSDSKNLPEINRSFIKEVFYLVSDRQKKVAIRYPELEKVFIELYKPLQIRRVFGSKLRNILDKEISQMVVGVENHLKYHFYDYVNKLSKVLTRKFKEGKDWYKVVKRLNSIFYGYKEKETIDEKYHQYIAQFQPMITESKYLPPQERLQCIFKITQFIEEYNENSKKQIKLNSLLPLRRSLIPGTISISREVCKIDFRKEEIWNSIKEKVDKLFKEKQEYRFSSLRTDGVKCSLMFTKIVKKKGKKKATKEVYLEDLKRTERKSLQDKNIVAIDPNKGNLLYCLDKDTGTIMRLTQDSIRKARKSSKYKKIRKEITNPEKYKELEEELSLCHSRTCKPTIFMEYIRMKNKQSAQRLVQFQTEILRKLKFNSWINTRKLEDRWVSEFRKTYGDATGTKVVIGDWEQRKGLSFGKEPTKGIGLRSLLRKAGYTVYLLDEKFTSRRCCRCHSDNEYNFTKRKDPRPWMLKKAKDEGTDGLQKVWGLSRCTNGECRVVHNRDLNSVTNILNIAASIIQGNKRPEWACSGKQSKLKVVPSGMLTANLNTDLVSGSVL